MRPMFRILACVAVMGLTSLVGARGPAWAADKSLPSLDYLEKWVGQCPTGPCLPSPPAPPFPKEGGFFEDPNVIALIRNTFAKRVAEAILSRWEGLKTGAGAMTRPVEKRDGSILWVSLCRPHFCTSDSVDLFFDLKRKRVQACWMELAKDNKVASYWLGRKTRRLPGVMPCLDGGPYQAFQKFGESEAGLP